MRKLAIGILSATFILGAGTYAFAQGNGNGFLNFEEMKPYMQKMHPNFNDKELQDMYQACHGKGGFMENRSPRGMMNNF